MNKDKIEKQLNKEAQERMLALKLNDAKLRFLKANIVEPVKYALYAVQNIARR